MRMLNILLVGVASSAALPSGAHAATAPVNFTLVKTAPSDWNCPVCGMTFNASVYPLKSHVLFNGGQTLAIGGEGCVKKIIKDGPSAFLNDTVVAPYPSRAGETLTCPVSGETFVAPADDDAHYVQFHHGQAIYTCCPMCVMKMKANLTKFIKAMPKLPVPSAA